MQTVSTAWKQMYRELLVPESFVEIQMNVGDPVAQADASSASNGEERFSDVTQIVRRYEKNPTKYGTLERNLFQLDGSIVLLPDTGPYVKQGYIGDVLSGDDGYYTAIPTITVSFSKAYDDIIPGITITWATAYNEWAEEYRVTAWLGGQAVAATTVTGNTEITSFAEFDITEYDSITLEVLKWCKPSRRPRIKQLEIGIVRTYDKADLMDYKHELSVDPLSAALPLSEITFSIQNLGGKFNPDNPKGAEKYLINRQQITARYGYHVAGEIEWIPAGTFYLSEWETPQNGITATFVARDLLEYYDEVYTGPHTGTLLSIAEAALTQVEVPTMPDGSVPWTLDSALGNIQAATDADLTDLPISEVLQYVANAARMVFYQDREGRLHIEPLRDGMTDYLVDEFNSYANSEISLTKPLKAVTVNRDQSTVQVSSIGETQKLDNILISDAVAPQVAEWAANYLTNRRILSGEYRSDPRLDPLDYIIVENQFARSKVLVTNVTYTYNGAFRGSYEGRSVGYIE